MTLNPIRQGLSHVAVIAIRGLGVVLRTLPPVMWGIMASALTPILWASLAKHRHKALQNLMAMGRSRKQAKQLGRASFRSNLLVFFESLAMQRIITRQGGVRVERKISSRLKEVINRIPEGRDPIMIAVSGHVGVWELLGAEAAQILAPMTLAVSARLTKNSILNDYLVRLREAYGMTLIEKEGMIRYVVKMVRQNIPHVHVFLCDQHFGRGEKVPFMKKNACTVSMPAILALKYRCPVIIGKCLRNSPGDYLVEMDLLDLTPYGDMDQKEAIRSITTQINDYIGAAIEQVPEQWTWSHRRWRPCCEEGSENE